MFDLKELDLILQGLTLLEDDIEPELPDLSGLVAASSAEEAQRIIESKIRDAKADIKETKRRVILLKAKIVNVQIETERLEMFNSPWTFRNMGGKMNTGGGGGGSGLS